MDKHRFNIAGSVLHEIDESFRIHGDWRKYSLDEMIEKVEMELDEVLKAIRRDDLHGDHGVIRELTQVAAMCIKTIWRLETNEVAQSKQDMVNNLSPAIAE